MLNKKNNANLKWLGLTDEQIDFYKTNEEAKDAYNELMKKGWFPEKGNLTLQLKNISTDGNFSSSIYYEPKEDLVTWEQYIDELYNIMPEDEDLFEDLYDRYQEKIIKKYLQLGLYGFLQKYNNKIQEIIIENILQEAY